MPAYDYVLIDATENDEHDRYSADGNTDELREQARAAIVDANVRASGGRHGHLCDEDVEVIVGKLLAAGNGRGIGISGPGGRWRVIAERVA